MSISPGVGLKRRLERRFGDASSAVGDRRGRDDCNNLEQLVFANSGRDESFYILIVESSTLLDHDLCQSRERGKLHVLGQATLADGLNIFRVDGPSSSSSGSNASATSQLNGESLRK